MVGAGALPFLERSCSPSWRNERRGSGLEAMPSMTVRRTPKRLFGIAVVAVSWMESAPVRAASDELEPIALSYEATKSCPSESEFVARVRTYSDRWVQVPAGSSRSIRIRLSGGRSEASGSFVLANAMGTVSEREIAGPDCAAVSQALAIMVAVAIDPRNDESPPSPEVSLANEPSSNEPSSRPDAPTVPRADRVAERPSVPTARRRHAPEEGVHAHLAFDIRAETTSAVIDGPLPLLGGSMKVEISFETGPRWMRGWRPSLGIGIRRSLPRERALPSGSAEFVWTAGNLRLCPFQLSFGTVASLSPCAESNLGVLRASAERFDDARQGSMTWLDIGGSLWGAVTLSRHVFLSATVLVSAARFRHDFTVASGAQLATVPIFGVLGGLGAGIRM